MQLLVPTKTKPARGHTHAPEADGGERELSKKPAVAGVELALPDRLLQQTGQLAAGDVRRELGENCLREFSARANSSVAAVTEGTRRNNTLVYRRLVRHAAGEECIMVRREAESCRSPVGVLTRLESSELVLSDADALCLVIRRRTRGTAAGRRNAGGVEAAR